MAHSKHSSRGCGSCGGGTYQPPPSRPPVYDPCGGGLAMTVRPKEAPCGCSACSPRRAARPPRNYNAEDCPTCAISCETKMAVRDCAKEALCELLRCMAETLCPDGKFDLATLRQNEKMGEELINCVGQAACTFMHCLPPALCPEPCETAPVIDCLPCDYAVEVLS